jgi:hypothetical protein
MRQFRDFAADCAQRVVNRVKTEHPSTAHGAVIMQIYAVPVSEFVRNGTEQV